MFGEPDDVVAMQDPADGIFDPLPGCSVDDVEDTPERLPGGLLLAPAGQDLGRPVHERDLALAIGGDHRVADAGEGDAEPLPLVAEACSTRIRRTTSRERASIRSFRAMNRLIDAVFGISRKRRRASEPSERVGARPPHRDKRLPVPPAPSRRSDPRTASRLREQRRRYRATASGSSPTMSASRRPSSPAVSSPSRLATPRFAARMVPPPESSSVASGSDSITWRYASMDTGLDYPWKYSRPSTALVSSVGFR